jgi:hypothetical protein
LVALPSAASLVIKVAAASKAPLSGVVSVLLVATQSAIPKISGIANTTMGIKTTATINSSAGLRVIIKMASLTTRIWQVTSFQKKRDLGTGRAFLLL